MKIGELFKFVGRPVAYFPRLSFFLGSVKATLFLCQFLYWKGRQRDPDGWIYKSQSEIQKETGLSRREQENARKQLSQKGYLEQKYKGIPRQLYYRINYQPLDRDWNNWINDPKQQSKLDDYDLTEASDDTDAP